MLEAIERVGAVKAVEALLDRILSELFSEGYLSSFVKCLRERTCVDALLLFDENVAMVFGKSGFISGGFLLSFDNYDRALGVSKAWQTEGCVLHAQRVYADQDSGAQKKLPNNFVITREERDGKGKVWA